KATSWYKGLWRDNYNAACEYLTKEIGDTNAEQELLDFADDFVIENAIVKNKRRNSVDKVQKATIPEKCNDTVSEQNNDKSFEITRDCLSKQIEDSAEEELLDCTDRYVVDNFTNK
ncbi:21071_t:CDS:2, partial [Dentiscutata erythropus]